MKTLLTVGFVLFCKTTFAGPIYSSHCPEAREIQTPPGASGFYMSENCKTVYVLPPTHGLISVVGVSAGNLSRCGEIQAFNKNLKKINSEINKSLGLASNEEDIKKLYDQRKLTIDQYADLADTQGASVELNFSNGINENIHAYQEYNNQVSVVFLPVALKEMKLSWNQVEKIDPEMRIAFNQSIPLPSLDDMGEGSFNGKLDLSLFGACPLRDPFTGTLPKKLKAKNVAGIITPNVVYKYDLGATYTYIARYNLSGLAQKIKEKSSSGGLFKSSTMSKLLEENDSKSWFKFEMNCDDTRICEQAKTETALSIKLRLMKEVLDSIALTTIGINVTSATPDVPGPSGAQTASEALRKCLNLYCQAGAVVLDVAQSIFGGSSQTENFIKKNDHWAIEEVKEQRPVSFTGSMGFKGL